MRHSSTHVLVQPSVGRTVVSTATRIADYAVMALALILGGGSIVLFAWPGHPFSLSMGLPTSTALWWNAALSFVFFTQHSVMVRRPIRARLATFLPARYDAAFYAITSGIALAAVAVLLQPAGEPLFVLHGIARFAAIAITALAVIGFGWGVHALRTFDPFGLRPIREHLRGARTISSDELAVRGPYRWVRHPLYSCVIVLLWADPAMSPGRLAMATLWTAWIYVGARLEERDLTVEFGDGYRQYRRQVPILIPWRGRMPLRSPGISAVDKRT